jgi:hypothetical protein
VIVWEVTLRGLRGVKRTQGVLSSSKGDEPAASITWRPLEGEYCAFGQDSRSEPGLECPFNPPLRPCDPDNLPRQDQALQITRGPDHRPSSTLNTLTPVT